MTKNSYVVGYGRTPVATRWPKGTSGNPAGRPKKRRKRAVEILEEILGQEVTVTENGRSRSVTVYEAIVLRLMHKANAGNASAGQVLQLYLAHAKRIPSYEIVEPMDSSQAAALYAAFVAETEKCNNDGP